MKMIVEIYFTKRYMEALTGEKILKALNDSLGNKFGFGIIREFPESNAHKKLEKIEKEIDEIIKIIKE